MSSSREYDPQHYWESRFSKVCDLTTVGHAGMGQAYNYWLHRRRFQSVARGLKRIGRYGDVNGCTLLDVGVGSGAWIPFWMRRGVEKILALDITIASIEAVGRKYPEVDARRVDITERQVGLEPVDVCTAFDILYHIVDDDRFTLAIRNIAQALKPGGIAVISDSFCERAWGPTFHEYHRSASHVDEILAQSGLRAFHVEPMFFTMGFPLCRTGQKVWVLRGGSWCRAAAARFARRRFTDWINHLIGGSLFLVDGLLSQTNAQGPGLKVMFLKKEP